MNVPFCQLAGSVLPGSFAATGLMMAAKLELMAALGASDVDAAQAHSVAAPIDDSKLTNPERCNETKLNILRKLDII